MKRLIAALLFILAGPAFAQQVPPYVYPVTIGTSQVTILPANIARKKLIFHNPNATALIAVCPTGPSRSNGAAITAAISGAGCTTILPYDRMEISGSTASGPQQQMPSAWIGIASAGGSSLTIIEFE
jgi:flavoprotein